MIRIAICDDEKEAIRQHEDIVKNSLQSYGIGYDITAYTQSSNLLSDITDDDFFYDLLLLDIEMPGLTGMELSGKIKPYLPNVKIIFITSHIEYAIDAFELSIFRYVPKSDLHNRLTSAVVDAAKLIELEAGREYIIQSAGHMEKIPYKDIFYIQRDSGKNSMICSRLGVSKVRKSLQQIFGETHMMTWYQIMSFFFTNWLRIYLGLYLAVRLLQLSGNMKKAAALSSCAAACITALSCFPVRQSFSLVAEIIILVLIAYYLFAAKLRMCLFLTFFYEITAALWEFIISAGLGIVFRSESFLNVKSLEYTMAVWIVRILMSGIVFTVVKEQKKESMQSSRVINGVGITGLLGTVLLSGQSIIPISNDQQTTWVIFSVLILMAIMTFYLNRQYEMEKAIAQLEKEKNALLERDYQTLNDTYAANAKLFHDFHNHIDVLHRYLSKGSTAEAIDYLENLRSPIQVITQTAWVGDEAVDYLINNKIALAASQNIRVNTNIEFPRHTNLRSVDLVAVLGNLLDNSLEATEGAEDSLRFINLTIRRINDMLIIKTENGCSAAPAVTGVSLQTSKTDKDLHGWGLRSVRTVAERYDGTIETEYIDHTFRTVVTLCFEAVKV